MQRQSAKIIAFPQSRVCPRMNLALTFPAADNVAHETLARDALAMAYATLDAALARQRNAVDRWRASIRALDGTIKRLGASARRLEHALD